MRADVAGARATLQLMAVVEAADSVREGCRLIGVHHSTFYEWRKKVAAVPSPELAFLPRDARRKAGPARLRLEAAVVAAALANPALGPRPLRDLVARTHDVGVGSESQVWRILRAHNLSTRADRYRVMAIARGLNDPLPVPDREWNRPQPGRLEAEVPGDLVQFDCFQVGRVKEARIGSPKRTGMVWQYTAIDVASSFVWSQLAVTAHNPSAQHTSALAHEVAKTLAAHEWDFTAVTTDRGNEFRDQRFGAVLDTYGIDHRYVKRPQTNGKVEQVHNTILEELWRPHFARHQPRTITPLRQALTEYLTYYNYERPHNGRWNQGTPPAHILIPNRRNQP
ncbi:MAG: integrase core domain-containing protein [Acidimicrobiia bacterium]